MEYILLIYYTSVVLCGIVLFHNRSAVKQETVKAVKEAFTEAGYVPSQALVNICVALSVIVFMTIPIYNTVAGWKGINKILNHQ
jgi:DNA-binding LacI/PurR family transcriptional regulator